MKLVCEYPRLFMLDRTINHALKDRGWLQRVQNRTRAGGSGVGASPLKSTSGDHEPETCRKGCGALLGSRSPGLCRDHGQIQSVDLKTCTLWRSSSFNHLKSNATYGNS